MVEILIHEFIHLFAGTYVNNPSINTIGTVPNFINLLRNRSMHQNIIIIFYFNCIIFIRLDFRDFI